MVLLCFIQHHIHIGENAVGILAHGKLPVFIPFNFWIQLLPTGEFSCKMKLTIKAELNMFIKGMVKKPLQAVLDKLDEYGMSVDDLSQDMLLTMVEKMSDEKLTKMMPYTQMVIKTNDGKALAHEDEIADAIDHRYSAMIDRKSVPGLA